MKINGMDATGASFTAPQEHTIEPVKDVKLDTKENTAKQEIVNIGTSNLTEFEKKELPISERVVIDAIQKANRAISGGTRRFEFSIHERTKQIMVKVIDSDTNEVVREIPPEKTLDMVAKMWEMAGIIVDERR